MLEKYYKYKIDYKEYVLLFKYGSFYESFGDDAFVISKIFKYKLVKIKDSYKCGFPINRLSYVLDNLCNESINFVVIDEGIKKRDFEDNTSYENFINEFHLDDYCRRVWRHLLFAWRHLRPCC